jgi:hypothetical protein
MATVSPFLARGAEMQQNLAKVLRHSTERERTKGLEWYANAHREVLRMADHYGYSIATTASVVAAISPQCQWEQNLRIAEEVLSGRGPATVSHGAVRLNVAKASRIRDDRASDTRDYFPGGPKVYCFSRNLAGDSSVVTVDSHSLQAALADPMRVSFVRSWSAYQAVADAYKRVAHSEGLAPADLQAIVWVTWKRLYPRDAKRELRRQW